MRQILHVDMDAFYASVEQFDNPEFQGHPVIVGADPKLGLGRGVVAACSYEARTYGIHSALPISHAWKKCPTGIYLRPRMSRYVEVSGSVMAVLHRYTDLVEPISIDEAFLDVTGSTRLLGPAASIGRDVQQAIKRETGLTASVGLAPNKFLAKIASDLRKPDGFVVVEPSDVEEFLARLPISRLWGVGPRTALRLGRFGVTTIGELAKVSRESLIEGLGASGEHLWRLAHGQDEREVVAEREPKSISNETTFERDTADLEQLLKTLRKLSDKVSGRLRRQRYRARTITLKLRYASFTTHTRQKAVPIGLDTGNAIFAIVGELFREFPLGERVRLLGVGAHNLVGHDQPPRQLDLFRTGKPAQRVADLMDEIQDRYGDASLRRGSDIP